MKASYIVAPAFLILLAGGCASRSGQIDATGGITAVRSACPAVGIPAGTGDITLFNPAASRDENAIDLVATMTHVRSTCADAEGPDIQTTITFDILARRTHADAARDVTLPYFITVVQGGTAVIAKRVGHVAVHFDAGRDRASTSGQATSIVNRAAATLPPDVKKRLTEKRKAGDEDAAIDPLTRPEVRQAVLRATFEALVGFQLTDDQLKYNVTR
ncbi:MAG: hypothetical protein M3R41_04530 [Pseudomonadota bacterium]|nr:hypothetical protein [Pseudomonadota bacterium]